MSSASGALGSLAVAVDPASAVSAGARSGPSQVVSPRSQRVARWGVAALGAALVGGGAAWALAGSTGHRLPGQAVTGQALGRETVAAELLKANDAQAKQDVTGAVKAYQAVLAADPNQIQALAGEGWLLVETGQPGLLKQGLGLLASAERVSPDYAPAHVYRGIGLLSEGDFVASQPELQWYLDHNPDPSLVAPVQKALEDAKAGVASAPALAAP